MMSAFTRWIKGFRKSLNKSPSQVEREQRTEYELEGKPPAANPLERRCAIIYSILTVLAIIAGLIVVICYLAFHPLLPGFHVEGGHLNTLFLDLNFALRSNITIVFSVHNPNSKGHVYYERIRCDLLLRSQTVSSVLVAPFVQGAKNTTAIQFVMNTGTVQLNPDVGEYLSGAIQRNRIDYDFEATVRTRARFGRIKFVKYTSHNKCQLEFSSVPPIGNGAMVAHDCNTGS